MSQKSKRYKYKHLGRETHLFKDLYYYLLKTSWTKLLLILAGFYGLANGFFALLYLAGGDCINAKNPGSFIEAFSFSVQTMATIGYGGMEPTTTYAHILITFEAFVGLIAVAMGSGLMFAKFSRPQAKVRFSNKLVVNLRDGIPCLQFRISNLRDSSIIDARVKIYVIKDVITKEGYQLKRPFPLELVNSRTPLFPLSWLLVHKLEEGSPIYPLNEANVHDNEMQIMVTFIGLEESLSQSIFAQHTYDLSDVEFNAHFEDMVTKPSPKVLVIDHSKIDQIKELI